MIVPHPLLDYNHDNIIMRYYEKLQVDQMNEIISYLSHLAKDYEIQLSTVLCKCMM